MVYRRTPAIEAKMAAQRQAVLDAAIAILSERGYAGCSMSAVAAKAGIATGSIYRHFPSKSELAVELFRTVVSREVAAVSDAAEQPGDLVERIVAVIETFSRRALKAPRLAYALLVEPVDPAVDAERLVFRRAFRDIFAERIAEGVASGVLPGQDPQITAAALVGAGGEMLIGPLSEHRDAAAKPDIVPAFVTFTLRALGASMDESAGGGRPLGRWQGDSTGGSRQRTERDDSAAGESERRPPSDRSQDTGVADARHP